MENYPTSHRDSKERFLRIDFRGPGGKGHAVVTCSKSDAVRHVRDYQSRGYEVASITNA